MPLILIRWGLAAAGAREVPSSSRDKAHCAGGWLGASPILTSILDDGGRVEVMRVGAILAGCKVAGQHRAAA